MDFELTTVGKLDKELEEKLLDVEGKKVDTSELEPDQLVVIEIDDKGGKRCTAGPLTQQIDLALTHEDREKISKEINKLLE